MGGGAGNPKGQWESQAVADLNDEMLLLNGSAWHDRFLARTSPCGWLDGQGVSFADRAAALALADLPDAPLLVLKEPRLCVLFDVWRPALEKLGRRLAVVVPYRAPLDCARSLAARDGFTIGHGLMLWLKHVVLAERDSRGLPRVFLRYDDLLDQKFDAIESLCHQLGLPLDISDERREAVNAYVDGNERHWRTLASEEDPFFGVPEVRRAFEALEGERSGLRMEDEFDALHAFLISASILARPRDEAELSLSPDGECAAGGGAEEVLPSPSGGTEAEEQARDGDSVGEQ
jgi:hypothetical protein